jgi:hypothetical protein
MATQIHSPTLRIKSKVPSQRASDRLNQYLNRIYFRGLRWSVAVCLVDEECNCGSSSELTSLLLFPCPALRNHRHGQRTSQMYNSLPVEIWRQILATAVRPCVHAQRLHTTGDVDVDDHDPFNLHPSHLLRETLRTKVALCLVSKGFNSLATEFLYENVHFRSKIFLPSGGLNRFWWTKVLVLPHAFATGWSAPFIPRLLSKCVNLRLLFCEPPTTGPDSSPDKLMSIYHSLPRGVQAICWAGYSEPTLENIPIIMLDNICQMSIRSTTIVSTHVITLPRLTYLRANDSFPPTNFVFPALKAVCFVAYTRVSGLESSPFGLFIQGLAKQITTLQIENGHGNSTVAMPLLLIDCCTNLTTLKYDPFTISVPKPLPFNTIQHTKLTHVYTFIPYIVKYAANQSPYQLMARFHPEWEANRKWLLNGQFPALKHITMFRSCVPDPIEEEVLSKIVSPSADPQLRFECGVSACT